jgi:hypothetical protein
MDEYTCISAADVYLRLTCRLPCELTTRCNDNPPLCEVFLFVFSSSFLLRTLDETILGWHGWCVPDHCVPTLTKDRGTFSIVSLDVDIYLKLVTLVSKAQGLGTSVRDPSSNGHIIQGKSHLEDVIYIWRGIQEEPVKDTSVRDGLSCQRSRDNVLYLMSLGKSGPITIFLMRSVQFLYQP